MDSLMSTIGVLRRAMPRNADVLAVCDALEARLLSEKNVANGDGEKRRTGRPRIGEQRPPPNEPWKACGMSRATWYRRRREGA